MKHTPGTWRHLGGSNGGRIVAQDELIAFVTGVSRGGRGRLSSPCGVANARLIAASPEMLSLLKEFIEIGLSKQVHGAEFIARIRSAIKKAEGR